jgi:opacity protein-like surface antigen
MVGQRSALWIRVWALTIATASLAMGKIPAQDYLSPPPPVGNLSNSLAATELDWVVADAAMPVESGPVDGDGEYCEVGCLEPGQRWYLALSGAVESRNDVQELGDPATFLLFDDGFALNAALGHQFDRFRLDFEYSLFNNQVETAGAGIPNVGNFVGDAVGNISVKAFTLNGYYDFEIAQSCWKPYVGAGLGVMQSEINSLFPSFFPALGAGTGGVNTTSNFKLCYQIRVGLAYTLSHRTELFSGYRFFDAGPLTFAGAPFGVFQPDGATFHSFEMGFRVKF